MGIVKELQTSCIPEQSSGRNKLGDGSVISGLLRKLIPLAPAIICIGCYVTKK